MPDAPETMRSRFEAAIKRHSEKEEIEGLCSGCLLAWPCPDYVANTRNLNDLNNAPAFSPPDGAVTLKITSAGMRARMRTIPDPLGGGDAD